MRKRTLVVEFYSGYSKYCIELKILSRLKMLKLIDLYESPAYLSYVTELYLTDHCGNIIMVEFAGFSLIF